MTIRAVPVVTGPAGTDWAYIVPGQWYPYLYGVTATLTTSTPFTGFPDETGNGHTATLHDAVSGYQIGTQGPWAGGVNNMAVFHPNVFMLQNSPFVTAAIDIAFGATPLSVDGWWNSETIVANGFNGDFWGLYVGGAANAFAPAGRADGAGQFEMVFTSGGSATIVKTNFMSMRTWHHVGWAWDGVNWNVYLDGVLSFTTATMPPLQRGVPNTFNLPGDLGFGAWLGSAAGVAFYPAALGAGTFAAHAAASSSWATYRAAVLASAPSAFWGLNTVPTGASRIVTLKVTDGTRTVAQYPASFAAATADSFTWSWQALGPGAAASTDGRINSVPIPEIRVDAGYVIRATSLDLAGTDQWGPVTLWFDDGTGPGPGGPPGGDPLAFRSLLLLG